MAGAARRNAGRVRNHPALQGMNIPKTGQQGSVGLMVTKTLVILGDPQVTTTPGTSARRDAARVRQEQRQPGRRGLMPAPQSGSPMTYRSTAGSTSSSPSAAATTRASTSRSPAELGDAPDRAVAVIRHAFGGESCRAVAAWLTARCASRARRRVRQGVAGVVYLNFRAAVRWPRG